VKTYGPRVVVVTARHRLTEQIGGRGRPWDSLLTDQIRGAVLGGADLIQVREPDLDARTLGDFLRDLFRVVPGSRGRVVVNDRIDVALATGASGVHLPERSVPPRRAVELLAQRGGGIVGRSVHSVSAIRNAREAGYLIGGTVRPSRSKAEGTRGIGWDGLGELAQAAGGTPLVAIGGLTVEDVPRAVTAGACGIAAIGYFVPPSAEDIVAFVQERVTAMRLAFDTQGCVPYTQGLDR